MGQRTCAAIREVNARSENFLSSSFNIDVVLRNYDHFCTFVAQHTGLTTKTSLGQDWVQPIIQLHLLHSASNVKLKKFKKRGTKRDTCLRLVENTQGSIQNITWHKVSFHRGSETISNNETT